MNFYQSKLFQNISFGEYERMRTCLTAKEQSFRSGDTICSFEDQQKFVGILASGSASTIRYETNGTRTILEHLKTQDIFGEVLSFQSTFYENIVLVCEQSCQILFFDYNHILRPCAKVCPCHQQLIQNMLQIISEKAISLSERVEVLSKRSIRDKLLCYFLHLAKQNSSNTVQLPFTMVDLADYLSVDRSAMTRELKKMKEDGLLTTEHRTMHLLFMEDIMKTRS